jgi:hypothetical protein
VPPSHGRVPIPPAASVHRFSPHSQHKERRQRKTNSKLIKKQIIIFELRDTIRLRIIHCEIKISHTYSPQKILIKIMTIMFILYIILMLLIKIFYLISLPTLL